MGLMPSRPYRLRASDLGFVEATYMPIAECTDENCGWVCRDATPKDCRDHVIETGHSVLKTRKTIARFYVRQESKI